MTDTNNTTNQQEEFSFIEWLKLLLGLNTENDKEKVYDKAAECYNKYVAGDGKENQITGEKLKKNDGNIQDTVKKNFEKKLEDKRVKNSLLFEKAINLMRTAGGQEATPEEIKQVEQAREDIKKEQEELKKYENELATLCGEGVDADKKIKDNEDKIASINRSNNHILKNKKTLEKNNNNLKDEISNLETTKNNNDSNIRTLKEDNKSQEEYFNNNYNDLLKGGYPEELIKSYLDNFNQINEIYKNNKLIEDGKEYEFTTEKGEKIKISGEELLKVKESGFLFKIQDLKDSEDYGISNENKINELNRQNKEIEESIEKHKNNIADNNKKINELDEEYSKNEKEFIGLVNKNYEISTAKDNKEAVEKKIKDLEGILNPSLYNKVDYSKALNEFKQSVGTKEYSTYMKAMETAYNLGIDPKKALKTVENYKPRALSKEWFRERKEKKKLDRLKKIESETCCGNTKSVLTNLEKKINKEKHLFMPKKEKKALDAMWAKVGDKYENWYEKEGKNKTNVEQSEKLIGFIKEFINENNKKLDINLIKEKTIKNIMTSLEKDKLKLQKADESYRNRCDKNAKLNNPNMIKNYYKEERKKLMMDKIKEKMNNIKKKRDFKKRIKNAKDIEEKKILCLKVWTLRKNIEEN